jgi:hypothetical protein
MPVFTCPDASTGCSSVGHWAMIRSTSADRGLARALRERWGIDPKTEHRTPGGRSQAPGEGDVLGGAQKKGAIRRISAVAH